MDYLNDFIGLVGEELGLSGIATLSRVACITNKKGGNCLVFTLNNCDYFINLASQEDAVERKKMSAKNIFNTLYLLTNSTNKLSLKDALLVAQQMLPCQVEYKFSESFSEKTGNSYKNLQSLKWHAQDNSNNTTDVLF